MKKEGILNEEARFDQAAFEKFVDVEIPPNLKEKALPMLQKCVPLASTIDPEEEMCKTYDPLVRCMLGFIGDVSHVIKLDKLNTIELPNHTYIYCLPYYILIAN